MAEDFGFDDRNRGNVQRLGGRGERVREELAFAGVRAHVRIANRFGIRRTARDQCNSNYRAQFRLDFADEFAQRGECDALDGSQSDRHDACAVGRRQLELGMKRLMRLGDRGIEQLQTLARQHARSGRWSCHHDRSRAASLDPKADRDAR